MQNTDNTIEHYIRLQQSIDYFIENCQLIKSPATKVGYKCILNVVENMMNKNTGLNKRLYDYCRDDYPKVLELLEHKYTGTTQIHRVNSFCRFHNLPFRKTEPCSNNKPVERTLDIKQIRDLIDSRPDIDKKSKMFFMLLTNRTGSIRNDYANMKIFERTSCKTYNSYYYTSTGTVDIKKLNKTGRPIKFVLEPDVKRAVDEYLSEYKGIYLFDCSSNDNLARCNFFSKFIKSYSKEFIGFPLTPNSFRRIVAQDRYDSAETIADYVSGAKLSDHSVITEINNYIDKTKIEASEGEMLIKLLNLGYTISK